MIGTARLFGNNHKNRTTEDQEYIIPDTHRKHVLPPLIWRVTTNGLVEDHRIAEIRRICQEVKEKGGINRCLVWAKGSLQYIVLERDDGSFEPFPFPTPDQIKTTPSSLYAKAVTYGKTWRRLLRRRLKHDQDGLNKTSKMIWVGGLIIIVLFIVFVVIVSMVGGSDDTTAPDSTVQQYGSPADLTLPANPEPSPEIPRGVKQ